MQTLEEISLFKDIIVPGCTALFAVWVAMRKFRKEQLWKDKYAAYQAVLRSLESIAHWASETRSNIYFLPTIGTEGITEEYKKAQREVLRQITIGPLVLSDDFCAQLEKFKNEFYTEQNNACENWHDDPQEKDFAWGEHAVKINRIVENHLPELIRLARRDLGA